MFGISVSMFIEEPEKDLEGLQKVFNWEGHYIAEITKETFLKLTNGFIELEE